MKQFHWFPLLFVLVGCSSELLRPLEMASDAVVAYGKVDARFCTFPPTPAKQNLKYLFILDHSASNRADFTSPLTPDDINNTDPQGSRRYGPLVNFIQTLVPDPNTNVSYALVDFNDLATQIGQTTGFTTDAAGFVNTVRQDWIGSGTAQIPAPQDNGFTDYLKALELAEQMIRKDAQLAAAFASQPIVTTAYQIIFVSDGVPTIATPGQASATYTQQFTVDIEPMIDKIMSIKTDVSLGQYIASVTLHAAYYSNEVQVQAAQTLLQQMAEAGNGQYVQFATGQNVMYEQFAPPPRNLHNNLVDVFISNENAVWSGDGHFGADSDADGLADFIESRLGSRPNAKDSDGNGVSDFVEYLTKGRPCDDATCLAVNRYRYAICAGFQTGVNPDGSVNFSSSTNDGLNDCEKYILGASRHTFTTNGNMIPDLFALKNSLPVIPGSGGIAYVDPFGDGLDNAMKIKRGLPIPVSTKSLFYYKSRRITLTPESSPTPDINCYHLKADNVALASPTDEIRVMVVQDTGTVQNKPFLMSASGRMDANSLIVSLGVVDFK